MRLTLLLMSRAAGACETHHGKTDEEARELIRLWTALGPDGPYPDLVRRPVEAEGRPLDGVLLVRPATEPFGHYALVIEEASWRQELRDADDHEARLIQERDAHRERQLEAERRVVELTEKVQHLESRLAEERAARRTLPARFFHYDWQGKRIPHGVNDGPQIACPRCQLLRYGSEFRPVDGDAPACRVCVGEP